MKTVCNVDMCCGCMACVDVCPKNAITVADNGRAYNAVIDSSKCVGCNVCHTVCQSNHQPQFQKSIFWKQGWAGDEQTRAASASGGAAAALEKAFVASGGVVYSCSFAEGGFRFAKAETEEDLIGFAGSKYVKSNPEKAYRKIKEDLRDGKKVLFVGLPCQVAAVINFCGASEALYTIDLICHGTPSPKLLSAFLKESGIVPERINTISFRSKNVFGIGINGKALKHPRLLDWYTFCFLQGSTYTENCYSCPYARQERVSDITLGDSWGSSLPGTEQRRGVSLLLAQTQKGMELLEKSNMQLLDVDLQNAIENNQQLKNPAPIPTERTAFWKYFYSGGRFTTAAAKAYPIQKCKKMIKEILLKMRMLK